jgi:hypothetical protein
LRKQMPGGRRRKEGVRYVSATSDLDPHALPSSGAPRPRDYNNNNLDSDSACTASAPGCDNLWSSTANYDQGEEGEWTVIL